MKNAAKGARATITMEVRNQSSHHQFVVLTGPSTPTMAIPHQWLTHQGQLTKSQTHSLNLGMLWYLANHHLTSLNMRDLVSVMLMLPVANDMNTTLATS